ncbi:MAG: AAA-like domain-containing protein [Cyanobacteriota bacterium]|nr:AAA-like domain-containing protein [Cyanobacteriota bacterium]
MTIDQIIQLLNDRQVKPLSCLQEEILRGAWDGRTYGEIAKETHYQDAYIKNIASQLWHELSIVWGEPIAKGNFRSRLEKRGQPGVALSSQHFPGAPLPANSPFYIERPPLESSILDQLQLPGSVTTLHGPRKMGKSSLLLQVLDRLPLRLPEARIVSVDLKSADDDLLQRLGPFLKWLCRNVSRQLNLEDEVEAVWDEGLGSKVNCTLYFEEYILGELKAPLILVINELNRLYSAPILQDVASLLRFWHEQSKQLPLWEDLRLVIVTATKDNLPLDPNASPFNIGLMLQIQPFNLAQTQDLGRRYDSLSEGGLGVGATQSKILLYLFGGHPYFTTLALDALCRGVLLWEDFSEVGAVCLDYFQSYFQSYFRPIRNCPEAMDLIRWVIDRPGGNHWEHPLALELINSGLLVRYQERLAFSGDLYQKYFQTLPVLCASGR